MIRDPAAEAAHREHCRHSVLTHLYGRDRLSFSAGAIAAALSRTHRLSEADVQEALDYLRGKGLAEPRKDGLGSSLYWQITTAGKDFFENGVVNG